LVSPLGKCFKPRVGSTGHSKIDQITASLVPQDNVPRDNDEQRVTDDQSASPRQATGTDSVVISEDIPILKVHSPPTKNSRKNDRSK